MTILVKKCERRALDELSFTLTETLDAELARALIRNMGRSVTRDNERKWMGQMSDGYSNGIDFDVVLDLSTGNWFITMDGMIGQAMFDQWCADFLARCVIRVW